MNHESSPYEAIVGIFRVKAEKWDKLEAACRKIGVDPECLLAALSNDGLDAAVRVLSKGDQPVA